jgi:elongation factor Ts
MMECKKALQENDGDMEAAREFLRKKGLATADKKASRVAAEGRMAVATEGKRAVLVEVNCETDFVAKDSSFQQFCDSVATAALTQPVGLQEDVTDLMMATSSSGSSTLEEARQALVSKIGENIKVRRFVARGTDDSVVGAYVHMNRIGVLVEINGGTAELASDIAMHVAAMNPPFATSDQVPAEVLEKERAFLSQQALDSGKPKEIVDKMVQGRIRKYLQDICLDSQTYVKTNDKTVGELLKENGASMVGFTRIAVGEGIEKKSNDFAAEVASMAAGK